MTQLIQITKTSDLLKAKPISEQLVKFGRNEVSFQISNSVVKCAIGLNIELSNNQTQILIEDLVDKYKFDSIEDIQQCLKKGRRGDYGPTYGKLNMIIISGWMEKHLELKAAARENQNDKSKHDFKTREEYESVVKIGLDRQSKDSDRLKKDKHDKAIDKAGYDEFKVQYEKAKIKLSDGEGTIQPEE